MRVAIFGNSGSGKSTLARHLLGGAATGVDLRILDLDTIAWEKAPPPTRRPIEGASADLNAFCCAHGSWVIEGCYGDLIEVALAHQPELIFLNPGEEACLANCRSRPWEPHKYATKQAQDDGLAFLLTWVSAYYRRDDDCSYRRHRAIFDAYSGPKREISNRET